MAGPGRALDPDKHFIVAPNHFGGDVSSSGLLRPIHGQTKNDRNVLAIVASQH
jgi:homoserine acetyltransferase